MNRKRIFAFLAAALLLFSMTACLVPKETDAGTADPTAAAAPLTGDDTGDSSGDEQVSGDFDGEAIAVELGDITITANEVANVFDSYISMFSYSGSIDEEIIDQCFAMVEDELIRYYLPLWKARALGVSLTDAETAEITELTRSEIAEERNALLCQFAYYYDATDDIYEDAAMLTEEQLNIALDGINEQLAAMFSEGFEFDDYLDLEFDNIYESFEIDRLTEKLKANMTDAPLDAESVDAWYAETLAEQQTRYDETPSEYYYDVSDYADGYLATPVLYAPEGYVRVQVVELAPEGEPDAAIEENRTKMSTLEAEYGALALNGGDEARKAEIEAEYAALKAENDALEADHYGAVRASAEEAYARLLAGESFEAVMDAYNDREEGASGADERLVYLAGADTRNGALADVVKALQLGEYSEPQLLDGAYVIVKLVAEIPAGPVERASIEDLIQSAARAALVDEAWEAQFDEWLTEAKEIAVFHRETYEMIGDMYLYY